MRTALATVSSLLLAFSVPAASDYPIRPVPFSAVKVQDAFWSPRLETNRTVTVWSNFKHCEDTGRGGCRVPRSWRLLYLDGTQWKPVTGASDYSIQRDRFNRVTFAPVTTTALRLEVRLQSGFSAGVLEWKILKP